MFCGAHSSGGPWSFFKYWKNIQVNLSITRQVFSTVKFKPSPSKKKPFSSSLRLIGGRRLRNSLPNSVSLVNNSCCLLWYSSICFCGVSSAFDSISWSTEVCMARVLLLSKPGLVLFSRKHMSLFSSVTVFFILSSTGTSACVNILVILERRMLSN